MSENVNNVNVCETILSNKLDNYNSNYNDFIASGEITVTITLSEYRNLVDSNARKNYEIDKANADKWKRESEKEELKKEIERLKQQLYDFMYGNSEEVKNERGEDL